ncbi:GSK3B-interacting protein [Thrips palmi]|uniref:GSK3B-interacting protein n=1 Tax=Thrips palmi TaxID=161013 RepID=A0A6P8YYE0_THRPL|nr:GSK3B-interacting protein [Thrips palmi]
MGDEKVLNKDQWHLEATAVINDVKNHVRQISISNLEGTDDFIFLNLTTIEGQDYCIQMSKMGFAIVDVRYDSSTVEPLVCFETPYALLDSISPKYRESFALKLIDSLAALKGDSESTDK